MTNAEKISQLSKMGMTSTDILNALKEAYVQTLGVTELQATNMIRLTMNDMAVAQGRDGYSKQDLISIRSNIVN